jgi:hypothetical protein
VISIRSTPYYIALVASIVFTVIGNVNAAVITAKSVAFTDVSAAVGLASDGDIVIVPAGTATWTSSLSITKNITIQGSTTVTGKRGSFSVNDQTIILDNVPRTGLNTAQAAFNVKLSSNQLFRITGFTFRYGTLTTIGPPFMQIYGVCNSVRMDHCHIDKLYRDHASWWHGWLYGVMDHNRFEMPVPVYIEHDAWNGQQHGDGSWADLRYLSSEKFCFLEDNEFVNLFVNLAGTGATKGAADSVNGGRLVGRYNYLVDCADFLNHGTESSGRLRSVRVTLSYNNTFTYPNRSPVPGTFRGGTGLWYNNTYTGAKIASVFNGKAMRYFRQDCFVNTWGQTDGTNPYDSNDPHGAYLTGKHTGANGSTTLVVSGAGWKTNQWANYTVKNTSQTPSAPKTDYATCAPILSNTSDTITYGQNEHLGKPMTFNTGAGFAVYKVLRGIDQPGMGKGDLMSGTTPINTTTGRASYPNQVQEPVYGWNNKATTNKNVTSELAIASNCYFVQENRDYYQYNASFNGTVGVGMGTLADRPSTCTKGVAYWATDQGSNGTLYQCSGTNTWTQYYQPYTYPHPLVRGVPSPHTNHRPGGK